MSNGEGTNFQDNNHDISNEYCTFCLLPFLLLFTFVIQLAASAEMQWHFRPAAGYVDTTPAVGDVDKDGKMDLVLCTTVGRVMAVDANGRQVWHTDVDGRITNPPVLADINADQAVEILVLTNEGNIVCLGGKSGARLWDFKLPAGVVWGTTSLTAARLQNNGPMEIIAADRQGNLVCLNGKGGQLWNTSIKGSFNSAPAVADLDGDGKKEILLGSNISPLICFSNLGKERWRVEGEASSGSSPLICDLNRDRQPEILVGMGKKLTALNSSGKILWQYAMKKAVHDAISVGDLDQDGNLEIVAADLSGSVVCLGSDGKLLWTGNVRERVRRSPSIADVDGDFQPEILIAGYSAALYVFSTDGIVKECIPLKGNTNATPTVVDFRNDGRLSVVCPTSSDVEVYSWFKKKPSVKPQVLFVEYRGNSARTGALLKSGRVKTARFAEVNYGNLYVGSNEFSARVKNPQKKQLRLFLKITKDNTAALTREVSSSDTIFTGSLPYTLIGQGAVNLKFTAKLSEGSKTKSYREQLFYLIPFAKDLADLHQGLEKIRSAIPELIESRFAADRLTIFTMQLAGLEKKTRIAGMLSALQRSELRDQLSDLRKNVNTQEKMIQAAIETGTTLAAYPANPWAPFGGTDEIAEGRTIPGNISVEAFHGEIESAALNISNFGDRPVVVRIEPEEIICEGDSTSLPATQILKFHEVLNVPTQALDFSPDALPLLNQAQTINVSMWNLRQLWISVNTTGLKPGLWKSVIHLRSLEIEPQEITVPLTIRVWRAKLPEKQPLNLCHWGYVQSSVLKDMPGAALRDQVEHGTNVFVATAEYSPKASFDERGNLVSELDFSRHDEYLRRHHPRGFILFFNYQSSLTGPAKPFTKIWKIAYARWLKAWFRHLTKSGLGYQDFALYPVDEPGLHEGLVDKFISYSKVVRQVDSRVRIYADPVAGATLEDLKKMAPFVDIWCPNRNAYLLKKGQKKLQFIKSTGKTVWTYECDANAKHQSPLGYYRSQAWLVWHRGLTGIGFWSYCTSRYDPWYTPVGGNDYLLIYQGNGVVSSKRWEAVRDGVEDYSMLMQLRKAVEKSSEGVSSQIMVTTKNLLHNDAAEIASYCGLDENGTLPGAAGLEKLRKVEDLRWEEIKNVRRKIAWLLRNLQKQKK